MVSTRAHFISVEQRGQCLSKGCPRVQRPYVETLGLSYVGFFSHTKWHMEFTFPYMSKVKARALLCHAKIIPRPHLIRHSDQFCATKYLWGICDLPIDLITVHWAFCVPFSLSTWVFEGKSAADTFSVLRTTWLTPNFLCPIFLLT